MAALNSELGAADEGPPTLAAPPVRPVASRMGRRILGWAAALTTAIGLVQGTLAWRHTQADPRALMSEVLYNVAPSLAACVLLTLLMLVQVRKVLREELEQPLRQLTDHVQALSPETLADAVPLRRRPGHQRDEIDLLADGFQALQDTLAQYVRRGVRSLESQTAMMQELLDALPNPVFVKRADGIYIACNRAYEQAFGMDRKLLIGRTTLDLPYFSPETRQAFHDAEAALMAAGGRSQEEVTYRYADGSQRTSLRMRSAVRLADGSIGGLIGIIVDISDRKRRERNSALRRDIFELIANGTPLPGLLNAIVSGLQEVLEARAALLLADEQVARDARGPRVHAPGWPELAAALDSEPQWPSQLVSHRLSLGESQDAAGAAAFPLWACIREAAGLTEPALGWSEPVRTTAAAQYLGSLVLVRASRRPFDEIDQDLLVAMGRVIGVSIERAQAEAQLERLRAEDGENRRQLKMTIDSMQEGFIRARMDDSTERVNLSLVRMLGYGSQLEMLGLPSKQFYGRIEDWRALVDEVMRKGFVSRLRCQARRRDGSTLWAEVSAHQALSPDGKMIGIEGLVRDVSTQIAAEEALQAARDEARAAADAKGSFLANMSHEIRTPMNAVIGLTELTLRTELTPQQRGYLGKARAAAGALLEMLNDLLDLTKIESDRLELESIAFDLSDVLDGAVLMVAAPIEEKGLALRIERADDVPSRLVGDPLRVRQVLINLISNACKFSERGQIVVRAERLAEPPVPGPWLRFTVTDPGIGMSPQQLERLFQPFVQADGSTTRRFGGTGLGLAISQQLVRLMGGDIRASSREGEGSTFTVDLPLPEADEPGERGEGAEGASDPLQAAREVSARDLRRLRGARVLLVEDNAINRHVARELLHQAGLLVDAAENGAQALQRLAESPAPYDCVLMDLQMPGMDGYTATRRLRENPAWTALPVLALTASVTAQDRQRVLEAGMNGHIAKPVLPADLYFALARWIRPQQRDGAPPALPPQVAAIAPAVSNSPLQGELPASLPGLDLDKALASTGGRPTLLRRLLNDFLRDHEADAQRIAQALGSGQAEDARRVAHTLRSVAGSLGARALQEAAAALELALRQGLDPRDDAAVRAQAGALSQALEEVMQGLRGALADLPPAAPASPLVVSRQLDEIEALLREMDPEAVPRVEALLASMPSAPPAAWQLAVDSAAFDFEAARSTLARLRRQLMPEAT